MNPLGGDGSGDGDIERRGIGRGRGRGPWASSSQEIPILRRPHHATSGIQTGSMESRNTDQSKLDKSFDDIIQNSTLSVHAAEFIPKSYPIKQHHQQQPSTRYLQKHSVQNRLQMAREIPLQVQMMQQQQQEQSLNIQDHGHFDGGSGDYKDKHQNSNIEDDNFLIEFANITQNLMSVIHSLILNPGHFASIVPPLISNLRSYLGFPSQFREIIKIIIQQSINEGNFRYSGARLCASLDSSLTPIEQTSFRWTLYTLCKNETESQASKWQQKETHIEEEQKKCHGLILLLAELVTQMDHTSAFALGDLLIQFIIIILKKPAPNSVKNVCQALKLAGQTLEKDKAENRRKEMENMMRALTELVTEGRVDSYVGQMVHSVHELRNENWGQNSLSPSTVDSNEPLDPNQAPDEPVLYGPDGKVLTPEENKFLEEVPDSTMNIEDHVISDHGYEGEEPWMSEDEDIDAFYEEFLKHIPMKY
ncbi:PREDICTED: uncharacterized protein LOC108546748 isoform X2 [Eufriesea mexicana]|uniref:uncharacterized protein LOC108546748 isoform X2 n=1 Tax=Eufriesea mexicana TaxID=516756 RepID=UPI00083C8594|nr:PREDICTED: uncharacterized protein LOC108546748 isoform X2 [Eufriesea mexicana]